MRSSSVARAAGSVASGGGLVLWVAASALAASPSPTAGAGGDPRSSGQGPGLVGDPLWAIAIVAAIGLLTVLATVAYVRATRGREDVPGR
jgi:hypothetical protein